MVGSWYPQGSILYQPCSPQLSFSRDRMQQRRLVERSGSHMELSDRSGLLPDFVVQAAVHRCRARPLLVALLTPP